jgi:hypothetical protein
MKKFIKKKFKSEHKIFLVLTDFFDHLSYFNGLPQIQSIYIFGKKFSKCKL